MFFAVAVVVAVTDSDNDTGAFSVVVTVDIVGGNGVGVDVIFVTDGGGVISLTRTCSLTVRASPQQMRDETKGTQTNKR